MQKIDKAYKGYTKFSNIGLILGLLGVYLMILNCYFKELMEILTDHMLIWISPMKMNGS
jgi:hypothetical protein